GDDESGDVRSSPLIKHVKQVVVEREANGADASRSNLIHESEPIPPDRQSGNLVASGVDCKQEAVVFAENQGSLRCQRIEWRVSCLCNRIAASTRRKRARRT